MYRSYLTDADIAATLWPDIFEGMIGSSITSAAQDVHEDSITRYPSDSSTADTDLPNFNADSDTAFTPTPRLQHVVDGDIYNPIGLFVPGE